MNKFQLKNIIIYKIFIDIKFPIKKLKGLFHIINFNNYCIKINDYLI